MIKLILFDCNGTLIDQKSGDVQPGVRTWFDQHREDYQFAICSNQGGVGLRHWMQTGGFGEPDRYPDEATARAHLKDVAQRIGKPGIPIFVCFAYRSLKSGMWAPTPPEVQHPEEWRHDYRKPAPGMLVHAMLNAGVEAEETLYVGDDVEDWEAAARAGVKFCEAREFFSREKTEIR